MNVMPILVEKPGCVELTGSPTYSKQIVKCANCGKEFHPTSDLNGGILYTRNLRKKNCNTMRLGKEFHFATTPAFLDKKPNMQIACCSFTCVAQIESVNESNIRYPHGGEEK